jgi:16S rRNA (cytosine967-C5)-methyltransferase
MPKPSSSNSRRVKPAMQNSAQKSSAPQGFAQPQPPLHAPITPARSAAFAILLRVADTSAHSDDLLHGPGMSALSQADRNLAHTLVLGVLRWQIALDARMQPLLQRPDQALPTPVATALRMGAFQLLHLDRIPAHAALSESVELVRAAGHPHAAGMVNAILRKLTRQPPAKPKLYETTTALAERLAHPIWLVNRWVQNYGRTAALAILAHDQQEPDDASLFTHEPDLPHLDDGSRLVAELASAAHPTPVRIWDTCAAPGGKTLILTHRHPAAHLLATDANPRRLQALTTRLETTSPQTKTLHADATQLPETEGLFDLILCDVPCSGTGTLSRNPEIRQRLQPADLARQTTRQREILIAALTHLAPGGHLLYSTCSLEPEENEQVVAAALATSPGIQSLPLDPILTHLATTGLLTGAPTDLLRNGQLRTLPGANFSGDGFFAALLHRP